MSTDRRALATAITNKAHELAGALRAGANRDGACEAATDLYVLASEAAALLASGGHGFADIRGRGAACAEEVDQVEVLERMAAKHRGFLTVDSSAVSVSLEDMTGPDLALLEQLDTLPEELRLTLEKRIDDTLEEWLMTARKRTLLFFLDFVFGSKRGPLPRKVLRRLFLVTRAVSPDHVWRMNKQDLADLFGETRANIDAQEKAEVEAFVRLWGLKTWQVSGGKSATAREKFARQKKGNRCRSGGKKLDQYFNVND